MKYYYNFDPRKIFSAIIKKNDVRSLRQLAKNKDIIITKPDKGRGVVIVNKTDYINSMETIIQD